MSPSSSRYTLRARPSNPSLYLPDLLPHDRETIPWDVDFANTASAYDLHDSAYNPKSKKTRRELTVCAPTTWHRRSRKSMSRSARVSRGWRRVAQHIEKRFHASSQHSGPTGDDGEIEVSASQVRSDPASLKAAPLSNVGDIVLDDTDFRRSPLFNPTSPSSTSIPSNVAQQSIDDEEVDFLSTPESQTPGTSLLETLSAISTNLTAPATDLAPTTTTSPSTPQTPRSVSSIPVPVISPPPPDPYPPEKVRDSALIAHLNAQISRLNEQNQWDREELLLTLTKQREIKNALDAAQIEIAGLKRAVDWGCGVMAAQDTLIDQLRRNPTGGSTPEASATGQYAPAVDQNAGHQSEMDHFLISNLILGGSWTGASQPESRGR
ncbi:hypothetical protein JCM24511_00394 [Saitozyma sp. JCM 24511]|nr:hypothetical protein JCM24511_00394 [Saitozyma sp. JCM 24511]